MDMDVDMDMHTDRRGENGDVGALWLESLGLLVGSEVTGLFTRSRREGSLRPSDCSRQSPWWRALAPPRRPI